MATTTPEGTAKAGVIASVRSHRNKVAAARLRVTVDKQLGIDTPAWIRELAAETESKAS